MPVNSFDLVVVGGGMVGAAAACGLAMIGYQVAMLDPIIPEPFKSNSHLDLRVSALSLASESLLRRLGAWEQINSMRLNPYSRLQTWEAGMDDRVCFNAEQIGKTYLGYMIENRLVQLALWQRCQQLGVEILNWKTWQLRLSSDHVVIVQDGKQLKTRLLVGSDGADSRVREQSGIGISGWQYRQHCLSVNVKMDRPLPPVTWQEFHLSGPRALLPLADGHASLIWYDSPEVIDLLCSSGGTQLKKRILAAFPPLPGDFNPLQWGSFALVRHHAQRYWQQRVVLCGDAAHTIHPLAGQGVNIGFKDVALLLQVLKGVDLSRDLTFELDHYQRLRMIDNLLMQSSIDLLYKTFSHPHGWIKAMRQAALKLVGHSGTVRRHLLYYATWLDLRYQSSKTSWRSPLEYGDKG